MIKICPTCGKEFWSEYKQRMFCNKRCQDKSSYKKNIVKRREYGRGYYNKVKGTPLFKNKTRKNFKNWYLKEENKSKQKRNVLLDYQKNKPKWISRKLTRQILMNSEEKEFFRKCKICGNKTKVELHHEDGEYPLDKKEVIKLAKKGKIIPLCKMCHENYHSKIDTKI